MKTGFITIFKSVDFARRRIPLIIHESSQPDPKVWVVAAVHGDEVTGTETVLRLNRFLKKNPPLKGTVYTLPVMNPAAYELIARYEPIESLDLNRCFPGSPHGNTTERLAYKIYSQIVATRPTAVIDLHTDTMESIPYVYLDQVLSSENAFLVDKLLHLAKLAGLNFVVENWSSYEEFKKSITGALINQAKIPAITLELGGPLLVKEKFVEVGLNSIKNILADFGMIETKGAPWVYPYKIPVEGIYETVWQRYSVDYAGIVEYKVQPGDLVKKGEVLARIKNLFDKTVQIIHAQEDSLVLSYADQSVCFPGTELFMTAKRNDSTFKVLE